MKPAISARKPAIADMRNTQSQGNEAALHRHWGGILETARLPEKTAADKQKNLHVLVEVAK